MERGHEWVKSPSTPAVAADISRLRCSCPTSQNTNLTFSTSAFSWGALNVRYSFALLRVFFFIDMPSFKNMNLQNAAAKSAWLYCRIFKKQENVHQSQFSLFLVLFFLNNGRRMLSLSFMHYWRARNKAEEGGCLSECGDGLPCPWLVYRTHTLGPVGPTGLNGSFSALESLRLRVCVQKNPSIHVEG